MKALVLENGNKWDMDEDMEEYLKYNNIEYDFYNLQERLWPKNRAATFDFFAALPDNQPILAATVFEDYIQLEFFIVFFEQLRDKHFIIKLMNNSLCDNLLEFYYKLKSDITPKEIEDDFKKTKAFKIEMNERFLRVLGYHDVYALDTWGHEILIKTLDDLYANAYEKYDKD